MFQYFFFQQELGTFTTSDIRFFCEKESFKYWSEVEFHIASKLIYKNNNDIIILAKIKLWFLNVSIFSCLIKFFKF